MSPHRCWNLVSSSELVVHIRLDRIDLCSPGLPNSLGNFLGLHLPLLFPGTQRQLAFPIVQGIICPLDAELAWLGACLAGADGWINVMVGIA